MPGRLEYREAIQAPSLVFSDSELKAGSPVCDALGLPAPISGQFATVFTLDCGSRLFAVKCFNNPVPDQFQRYNAVSAYLATRRFSWDVKFEFQLQGIRLGRNWFPIVKMQWVEATSLDEYVRGHLQDSQSLLRLAMRFASVVAELRSAGIAHGDLSHSNILIRPTGEITLVDYDGMFVPALRGRLGSEIGHRNYQHPKRTSSDFSEHIDNFSAWVIYLSLLALAVDCTLWTRFDGGDEKLILSESDFTAERSSAALAAIERTGHRELTQLAAQFRGFARGPMAAVPPLQPLVSFGGYSRALPAWIAESRGRTKRTTPSPQSEPAIPLPSWMPRTPDWLQTRLPSVMRQANPAALPPANLRVAVRERAHDLVAKANTNRQSMAITASLAALIALLIRLSIGGAFVVMVETIGIMIYAYGRASDRAHILLAEVATFIFLCATLLALPGWAVLLLSTILAVLILVSLNGSVGLELWMQALAWPPTLFLIVCVIVVFADFGTWGWLPLLASVYPGIVLARYLIPP